MFNHYYDRDIDRAMARTARRPLVSGALADDPRRALWLAGGLLTASMLLAAGALNWVVALHLFLGAFVYGIVYTVWLKRRTWLNIVIGGAAGSFAVLAGAAAVDPSLWLLPTLMAVFLFLWTPSHFWALAMLLKEDYGKAGIPMLPVVKGERCCVNWIFANTVALAAAALAPWALGALGTVYGLGAAAASGWFLWRSWRLVRTPGRAEARRVFLGSMAYLALVFLAVLLDKHLPW